MSRYPEAPVLDRARAMLFRAELAVRLGNRPLAQSSLAEALALKMSNDERALIASELAHATELVSGIAEPDCTYFGEFSEPMAFEWTTVHVLAVLLVATVVHRDLVLARRWSPCHCSPWSCRSRRRRRSLLSFRSPWPALSWRRSWRKIHLRSALGLIVPTFLGIPLGLLLLTRVQEDIVKAVLAVCLIGFSAYCLAGRRTLELKTDRSAWVFGLAAGFWAGPTG